MSHRFVIRITSDVYSGVQTRGSSSKQGSLRPETEITTSGRRCLFLAITLSHAPRSSSKGKLRWLWPRIAHLYCRKLQCALSRLSASGGKLCKTAVIQVPRSCGPGCGTSCDLPAAMGGG